MRITVIVPESLMESANHVHLLMGKSRHLNTFTAAGWQDSDGNKYAVSSGLWTGAQIAGVTNPDVLSDITPPEGTDLALVAQAQAVFTLHTHTTETSVPLPNPTTIIAITGENPLELLETMGLSRIDTEM